MAGAVVPLIASLAPSLIDLIVSLVHPKVKAASAVATTGQGAVAFGNVLAATLQDLVNAHAAGTLATVPENDTVKLIIQSVYTALKLSGDLPGVPTPTLPLVEGPIGAQSIVLKPGSRITISAAT